MKCLVITLEVGMFNDYIEGMFSDYFGGISL
jgi:hypothetical protein